MHLTLMAKERSKLQRRIDAFTRVLFLDENGKPKSATFLYSFLLAILFGVIYAASYLLLLDVLNNAFGALPVFWQNVLQFLIPAIVGSIPCVLSFFLFRDENKRLVPDAYLWLLALLVLFMLAALLLIDWSDAATEYGLFWMLLGLPMLVSALVGGIPAFLLYRVELKKRKAAQEQAKKRPSYYNT